jgi:hypothetical protein
MRDQQAATGAQRARATLELAVGGSSPVGSLITAEGTRLSFSGWAELGAAIEEWRATLPATPKLSRASGSAPTPTD